MIRKEENEFRFDIILFRFLFCGLAIWIIYVIYIRIFG